MSAVIETRKTGDTITISIPNGDLTEDEIRRLVDLIKAGSIIAKSKLSQGDADDIADEIKRSWWNKNKHRIEKMIADNE